ncbi:MAG: D-xylose 1-dehydrogenase Gfo6 [Halobacteriaceae archaeon]
MDLHVAPAERDWETTAAVDTLRVAVVGLGRFARRRALPAVAESDHCTATAVVSGDREKAAAVAGEHGVANVLDYDAYADGERAAAYDAAYVCTPNALHPEHVAPAARADAAVLCEKPLAATVDGAEAVTQACREAGVLLMTAYRMQTDPLVRRMRGLVREGAIGDPVKLHGEFSIDVLAAAGPDQWRLDADLAGGGALVDVGIYPLNTARFLLDADPVAVSGTVASPGDPFDEVETHVAGWARFEGPQSPTLSLTASYRAHLEDTLQVLGTDGQLRLENAFGTDATRRLTVEAGAETATYEAPTPNELVEEFDYLAHAASTGAAVEPDGADGLTDVVAMQALYESADTGAVVSL